MLRANDLVKVGRFLLGVLALRGLKYTQGYEYLINGREKEETEYPFRLFRRQIL